jgi:hypothetical protein
MGKKIPRTTIVVQNIKTGQEYKHLGEQMPRKKEPGVVLYAKINPLGIQTLQSRGLIEQTVNQKKFDEWVAQQFDLPAEAIGTIARIDPDTGKGADEWKVMVGNDVVFPKGTFTPTNTTAEEPSTAQSNAAIQEPETKPQTEGFDRNGAIEKVKAFKNQGATEEDILAGLKKKVSEEEAKAIIEEALRPKKKELAF